MLMITDPKLRHQCYRNVSTSCKAMGSLESYLTSNKKVYNYIFYKLDRRFERVPTYIHTKFGRQRY